jgi:hypothetical protein
MAICENCNFTITKNYGSGRFCSTKCARGFSTKNKRLEINDKVSKTLKLANRKMQDSQKIKLSHSVKNYWKNRPRKLSEETKRKIGEASKKVKRVPGEKVLKSCKICNNQHMILKYSKICELCKGEKRVYRENCSFKFNIYEFPNNFELSLIERYGWYSPKNSKFPNLNGISRDHILSVSDGFLNGISPTIISHPANCKLVRHSENQIKHAKSNISISELLLKIENWNKLI